MVGGGQRAFEGVPTAPKCQRMTSSADKWAGGQLDGQVGGQKPSIYVKPLAYRDISVVEVDRAPVCWVVVGEEHASRGAGE